MLQSEASLGKACPEAAPGKGDTYLSENISVTDALMETDLGRKLRAELRGAGGAAGDRVQ